MYEGTPGVDCTAGAPEGLLTGMNKFLKQLEITFRWFGVRVAAPVRVDVVGKWLVWDRWLRLPTCVLHSYERSMRCCPTADDEGAGGRRDPENYRPRINKADSQKDSEQKKAGTFFYMDE